MCTKMQKNHKRDALATYTLSNKPFTCKKIQFEINAWAFFSSFFQKKKVRWDFVDV